MGKSEIGISSFGENLTGKFLARLQHNNIFYMLSACLMLLGCYLVCVPYLLNLKREVGGLLVLLGTINVYEGLVVLASGYVCRRAPASRESSTLLIVSLLFLLDVTFTINACLPVNLILGVAVAGFSFVLALAKLYALEMGAGYSVYGRLSAFLIPALLFLYSFQGLLVLYPQDEHLLPWREAASGLAWLLYGTLPLPLIWIWNSETAASTAPPRPWWQTQQFGRVVVILALVLTGLQLLGQSWVYRAPLNASNLVPLLLALLAVAHQFVEFKDLHAWRKIRIGLACGVLLFSAMAAPAVQWPFHGFGVTELFTTYRIHCIFAALVLGLLHLREGGRASFDAAFSFSLLALMGHSLPNQAKFLMTPELPNACAVLVLGAGWLALHYTPIRLGLLATFCLWVGLRLAIWEIQPGSLHNEFWRWWLACLLAMRIAHKPQLNTFDRGLLVVVWCLGVWNCGAEFSTGLPYFYGVALVLLGACIRKWRVYGAVLLTYLLAANLAAYGAPVPSSAAAWGWLVIVLAFVVFALAFQITRRRLVPAAETSTENSLLS